MIQEAKIEESTLLTEIALVSKAYWGYSNEQLESWRKDLTISVKMIEEMMIYTFVQDTNVVGFYALNPPVEQSIELEMLFVLPNYIGKSIGKQLLLHSFNEARKFDVDEMTLLADPNAVSFYKKQGFEIIAKKESSIPNRYLPIMRKKLSRR